MDQRFFITSTGTGIGKSFITAALVRQAKAMGKSITATKPVISGFDPADVASSDTGLILESLGLPTPPANIDHISPWRYAAPLAPSMAARMENRPVDFQALIQHGKKALQGTEDIVLIEGVGGVMVPLDDRHTVLDWMVGLGIPALLVTGTYLGSISHTLTAIETLRQKNVPLHAVILNESEGATVTLADTADELKRWVRAPLFPVTRRADGDWRDVGELRGLLQSS